MRSLADLFRTQKEAREESGDEDKDEEEDEDREGEGGGGGPIGVAAGSAKRGDATGIPAAPSVGIKPAAPRPSGAIPGAGPDVAAAPPARGPAESASADAMEAIRALEERVEARLRAIEEGLGRVAALAEAFARDPNPFVEMIPDRAAAPPRAVEVQPPPPATPPAVDARIPRSEPSAPFVRRIVLSPRTSRILLSWARDLVRDVGHEGVPEALALMESLGWIGPDVRARVARLAAAVSVGEGPERLDWRLDVEALRRSLAYVEELAGLAPGAPRDSLDR